MNVGCLSIGSGPGFSQDIVEVIDTGERKNPAPMSNDAEFDTRFIRWFTVECSGETLDRVIAPYPFNPSGYEEPGVTSTGRGLRG